MKDRLLILVVLLGVVFCDEYHSRRQSRGSQNPRVTIVNVMEGSRSFWNTKAQNYIASKVDEPIITNKAKNVIFFIGDGMSQATVAAARMHLGKEEAELSFEKFPHLGFAKTYCVDKQVADSACSGTAFLSGVKTNNRLLGYGPTVLSRQCLTTEADKVENILHWAQKSKKATGIVTTTRITHATPGASYANVAHRDWENNAAISSACRGVENVTDIAYQLIHNEVSKNFKVIFGGGRRNLINTTALDDEGRPGYRTDGRNLIKEWVEERNKVGKAEYIWHKQQLDEIDVDETDFLMGLFESDHCMYTLDIMNNNLQHQEPTLTDMAVKAVKMLQKEENGYVLFVEGGKIDHGHHSNRPHRVLDETRELARAVDMVRQMTSVEDTLIVVSADHSHVMTYNGYPNRGNDIFGVGDISDEDWIPFETLSYSNGPGYDGTYNSDGSRVDVSKLDLKYSMRRAGATVPLSTESHAGEDVAVYASGPWSQLFVGSYEQNNLPILMAYAAQIGPYANGDDDDTGSTTDMPDPSTTTDAASLKSVSLILIFGAVVLKKMI